MPSYSSSSTNYVVIYYICYGVGCICFFFAAWAFIYFWRKEQRRKRQAAIDAGAPLDQWGNPIMTPNNGVTYVAVQGQQPVGGVYQAQPHPQPQPQQMYQPQQQHDLYAPAQQQPVQQQPYGQANYGQPACQPQQ